MAVCRDRRLPVLARGGGTSLAGQGCNTAVLLDFSRHMNKILELDAGNRTATVQPGVVLDDRRAAAAHGLTFGPDPATHSRCTLGGMIGNNSCGVHSIMAGRTADNVQALESLTYRAARMWVGKRCPGSSALLRANRRARLLRPCAGPPRRSSRPSSARS